MNNSENEVMVQAVRTFQGEEGFKNPQSAPFPVSRQRFADLKANGLVVESVSVKGASTPETKNAPPPANKMAPDAANKVSPTEGEEGKALTVAQIKEALAANNVEIPEGVTIKADLQALLDAHRSK